MQLSDPPFVPVLVDIPPSSFRTRQSVPIKIIELIVFSAVDSMFS